MSLMIVVLLSYCMVIFFVVFIYTTVQQWCWDYLDYVVNCLCIGVLQVEFWRSASICCLDFRGCCIATVLCVYIFCILFNILKITLWIIFKRCCELLQRAGRNIYGLLGEHVHKQGIWWELIMKHLGSCLSPCTCDVEDWTSQLLCVSCCCL